LKLPKRIGLQVILRMGAADVADERVNIPVDPEAGHRIAQQRNRSLVIDIHAYKRSKVGAADGTNVAEPVRQAFHRGTKPLDQLIGIPGVRLLTLDHKRARTVTFRQRLVCLGSSRMLHAMFAGSRIEREFEMVTVQRQNLLALMLMQAVSVRLGVRRQTQVL
jgi:hypothetical protein